jgi:hypothetical protein
MRKNKTVSFSRVLKRLGMTKVSAQSEGAFLKWLDNHNMVIQSHLASDTLLVSDPESPGNKKRMNKILLQIPVRELHNDLVSGEVSLNVTFFECVAEVRDSPNSLRILFKYDHIMMTMGMY